MNTAEAYQPPTGASPAPRQRLARPSLPGLRLMRLHLASRRVPVAVAAIAACAAVLRFALQQHWGAHPQQVPLVIETATATIIATTTRSPFGDVERATGRWLPYLRPSLAGTLTAVAVAALAAGSAGAHLPGGNLELLRDLAGLVGIGLLSAAVLGSANAWIGPIAYTMLAEYAITAAWTSRWIWPARPPHDPGAAICAAVVFAAGTVLITTRGARDSPRE
jgi:hypothetical protein